MSEIPKCYNCVHFTGKGNNRTCSAFPEKIPVEIWSEMLPHYKPVKNQIGDFVFPLSLEEKSEIKDLILEKTELEEEVVSRMKKILLDTNKYDKTEFIRGEIRLRRRGYKKVYEWDNGLYVLFFDKKDNASLAYVSAKVNPLSQLLRKLLHIESIENHKTEIELIIHTNGEYSLNFFSLSYEEWRKKNKIQTSILRDKERVGLIDKGLKKISEFELERYIKQIHKVSKEERVPDYKLTEELHIKGYAVLKEEVREIRKRLGLKIKK